LRKKLVDQCIQLYDRHNSLSLLSGPQRPIFFCKI
jgi:hypothetical protein